MNALDRHARKQVLLTRIAFDRAALRDDIAGVHQAVRLPNLLRDALGGRLGRQVFGHAAAAADGGWVTLALTMFRRYRGVAALLGGLVPVLGARGGWRRGLRLASLAAAVYAGWRVAQATQRH
ncbi:MAG TPA: hypothetical protein VNU71_14860 [Burkholderiaceae bacterium]|nr:hypothetical protein [Burkholderiaceae bacterium]